MKVFYSALVLTSLMFTSCKNELEPQESSVSATETPATVAQPAVGSSAVTQNLMTGTPKINPPHGQPGHRCDIPDGAPLPNTTAPATAMSTSAPTQMTPQMVTSAPAVQAPVKTAKGMNPPHGQPGHRCDISVGAPLSSAPKTAATTTTSSGSNPLTVTPAMVNSDGTITPGSNTTITTTNNNATPALLKGPSTTATAPGMNPPHGEAGHVCAVAVGAPLPK